MAELKTKRNDESVDEFIDRIDDDAKRGDSRTLRGLMAEATGDPGAMWGSSIVGFGTIDHRYASGREIEWFKVGFSPRKQTMTLYIMDGFDEYETFLGKLGKHSTGKACLYVKRLSDIDMNVLTDLVGRSVRHVEANAKP